MQVTFTANSARELHEQIVSFSKEFGISSEGSRQQTLPGLSAVPSIGAASVSTPATVGGEVGEGKRTRRTKAQIEADEAAAKAHAAPAAANTDFTGGTIAAAPVSPAPAQPASQPAAASATAVTPTVVATPQQKQQVTEALTSVNGKFGLPIARGLLMKFGTDRLSSLDASKYGDFLTLCDQVKLCATAADAQKLLA